jgi:hypothetical protein
MHHFFFPVDDNSKPASHAPSTNFLVSRHFASLVRGATAPAIADTTMGLRKCVVQAKDTEKGRANDEQKSFPAGIEFRSVRFEGDNGSRDPILAETIAWIAIESTGSNST